MNLEVDTPDDFSNCRQSTRENLEDPCVTQPSILYLLQEATKIATPVNKLDAGGSNNESEENIVSCNPECFTSQKTNCHKQGQTEIQPSFKGAISVKSSSPWEVMSLINLQCERLLHSKQLNREAGYSHTDETIQMDTKVEHTEPLNGYTEVDTFQHRGQSDVCWSMPHIIDGTDHLTTQTTSDAIEVKAEELAELISKNTEEDLHSSTVTADENRDKCYLVETPVLPLDLSKKEDLCESSVLSAKQEIKMASEISSIDFTSSLVSETEGDSEMCFSFDYDKAALKRTPQQFNTSHSRTDINNNLEQEMLQDADKGKCKLSTCRRTLRKQAHPERSPDFQDSERQGVKFSMHTELDHDMDQCRLLITSNYNELCRRSRRSRVSRSRSLQSSQRTSSSEEESDSSSLGKKICASCCTKKTPLWRDAEDGTPLCNACGIRYKKYRVRCLQCWNIPRKESSSNTKCLRCGDLLRLAAQNKRTSW